MAKQDRKFEVTGTIIEKLRGGKFKVQLEDKPEIEILCTLSGKLRTNKIYISLGDRVDIDIDVADTTKGRIIWRYK